MHVDGLQEELNSVVQEEKRIQPLQVVLELRAHGDRPHRPEIRAEYQEGDDGVGIAVKP